MAKKKFNKTLLIGGAVVILGTCAVGYSVQAFQNNKYEKLYIEEQTKNSELTNLNEAISKALEEYKQQNQSLTQDKTNLETQVNKYQNELEQLNKELLQNTQTMNFEPTTNTAEQLSAEISVVRDVNSNCAVELNNINFELNKDKFYSINYVKDNTQFNFTNVITTYLENEKCTVLNAETQDGKVLRIYAFDYSNIIKLSLTGFKTGENITLNCAEADETQVIYWHENDIKKYVVAENNTIDMKVKLNNAIKIGTEYSSRPTTNVEANLFINGVKFLTNCVSYQLGMNGSKYRITGYILAFNSNLNETTISNSNLEFTHFEEKYDVVDDEVVCAGSIGKFSRTYENSEEIKYADQGELKIQNTENPLTINLTWEI